MTLFTGCLLLDVKGWLPWKNDHRNKFYNIISSSLKKLLSPLQHGVMSLVTFDNCSPVSQRSHHCYGMDSPLWYNVWLCLMLCCWYRAEKQLIAMALVTTKHWPQHTILQMSKILQIAFAWLVNMKLNSSLLYRALSMSVDMFKRYLQGTNSICW